MDLKVDFEEGLAAHRAGDLARAESAYRRVLSTALHLPAFNNITNVLHSQFRFDEAEAIVDRAVKIAPDEPRVLLIAAGHFRLVRKLDIAGSLHRHALALAPENAEHRYGLALTLITQGRLEEAWPWYEARPHRRKIEEWSAKAGIALWDGSPLEGRRLLVWSEQGYGDQIKLARLLPALAGGGITYAGQPVLQRLIRQLGVDYLPHRGEARVAAYDCVVPAYSLPLLLGVTEHNLSRTPYLTATPRPCGGRVGVAWRGNPGQPTDVYRSLPVALGRQLEGLPGAVSLAPEDTGAADFQDTADMMAGLDLVVTVDTAVAHLAAAVGVPVWIMLPVYSHSIEWPPARPDLWYSGIRTINQSAPGDWESVLQQVRADWPAAEGATHSL